MIDHSTIVWHLETDTAAFAKHFAAAHDLSNGMIELQGDLGAGKTTFARYLLQELGVTGRIKSPSYAIVETYDTVWKRAPLSISHFDFYRFNDPQEWEDAGFRDLFAAQGLKIIEWADKARALLPQANWTITIQLQDDGSRRVTTQGKPKLGSDPH